MTKTYTKRQLDNIVYPMGGMGAGMVGLCGTGSFGSISVRNEPNVYEEPNMFAAIYVKNNDKSFARVLEGQVPYQKTYGTAVRGFFGAGNGMTNKNYGLPRFRECEFTAHFPFAEISLKDCTMPVDVIIEGYSPFIPGDPDASSLPAASVRYTFHNKTPEALEAVFYFNSMQFMNVHDGNDKLFTKPISGGFKFVQEQVKEDKATYGEFAITTSDKNASVDIDFYRGGWWDTLTMLWNKIAAGETHSSVADDLRSPGASIEIPLTIAANSEIAVTIHMNWYVPNTNLRFGYDLPDDTDRSTYKPWYSARYSSIEELNTDYLKCHDELLTETRKFSDALYDTTLPDIIMDAVASNLTILKSPTCMRQTDGRFWGWEGSSDTFGSCHGTCQHVWNYAQAMPHLFPSLERQSFREVEFNEDMNEEGHQQFRTSLPIRKNAHDFHAASDGQPGGIMKMYREWRISGNTEWIKKYWDKIVLSMEYCIEAWDPDEEGVFKEPHHNTYDIEFWGADGMCSSFYIGALAAVIAMGKELGNDISRYEKLYTKGRHYLETKLWNGEYFYQIPEWKTLHANFNDHDDPVLVNEGPKYQYGTGCISDGVLGAWLAKQCFLGDVLDPEMTKTHLLSVYKYNFRKNLLDHANPQRPGFAVGDEGGLLLCSWPYGNKPSIPFVYSDEVWTGIEYQVACHLASFGCYKEAEDIVTALRARYDGERRNPYDEYECGHWYARALASYGLLESFTGVNYDAVTKTLHAGKGKYKVFLCTDSGYGTVESDGENVTLKVIHGEIPVENIKTA